MKIKLLGSLALTALIFSACSVRPVPYHSAISIAAEKNIEFRSINTVTDFTVVEATNDALKYPAFGVISAVDNGTEHYTLLAPTFDEAVANGNPNLEIYNRDHAIALTDAHTQELIELIDLALADWSIEYFETQGKNLAYTVISDEPSLDFHYQNSQSGALASIIIATGKEIQVESDGGIITAQPIAYSYDFASSDVLKGFQDLLIHSLNPTPIVEEAENTAELETTTPVTEEVTQTPTGEAETK